jgi:uncharacterized damage-inducible protein DinB
MKQHVSTVLMSALVVICSATFGFAQGNQSPNAATTPASGPRAELLRQLDAAQQKLVALAEAIPQEKYSWRPGEGVRSVSEVYMHVAGANYLIPQAVGVNPPSGLEKDLEKITEKSKVVDTLKQSFAHVRLALLSTSDTDLDKSAKLFGNNTSVRNVFLTLVTHAHEHLGQAIAYARMNNITPPWTAARQSQPQRSNPR